MTRLSLSQSPFLESVYNEVVPPRKGDKASQERTTMRYLFPGTGDTVGKEMTPPDSC
jgi:hypothetical protein